MPNSPEEVTHQLWTRHCTCKCNARSAENDSFGNIIFQASMFPGNNVLGSGASSQNHRQKSSQRYETRGSTANLGMC